MKQLVRPPSFLAIVAMAIFPAIAAGPLFAQDDLSLREEKAIQAAVAAVAPSVVRIETLGGLETVGGMLVGTGPTTGLIISPDGYIISSAFNFAQKPTQALVYLNDGKRLPATIVSTDFNRKLVLLKVEADQLPVAEAAPMKEVQVGQWAIAVGRTFGDGTRPNVSAGIISARNRIWSKAVQTDAKVSPTNYGGPLIDIAGRVVGVLVPLAQDNMGAAGNSADAAEVAGVDWYDSGIGFAIPIEQVANNLNRMKKQPELHSGLLGVSLRGSDLYSGDVVIAAAPAGSPAHQAGMKPGDKIVEIDGAAITRQVELRHALGPRYAGDKVEVVALRGAERLERQIELVAKLTPYEHPFLGILPLRDPGDKAAGVAVRFVYPDSPAATAGFEPQDRIIEFENKTVENRNALIDMIAAEQPEKSVTLEVSRAGNSRAVSLKLARLPESIPQELPAAHGDVAAADSDSRATGVITIKIPEVANNCAAYVPKSYKAAVPHGVVIWLHPPGGYKEDELGATWNDHLARHDLILLAPKSADATKWQRNELEFIRKSLDDLVSRYNIDRKRVVAVGQEGGGTMALLFALANREHVQGAAAIDAALPSRTTIPGNDPIQRQAFFLATFQRSAALKQTEATIKQLRAAKYPVTVKDLGEQSRLLSAEEHAELARWIDALDRI
jgi:serine protease Do